MSSFSSLQIGVSALSTSQRAVEVAAHNVANASTTGFTRQRLEVGAATPTTGTLGLRGDGQRGMGVTVIGVERLRDRLSDTSYRSAAGASSAADARSTALGRVEQVVGQYGEGNPEALSRFLASWDQLSLTPHDPSARSSVLAAGAGLADGLVATSKGLDDVSREVGLQVTDAVGEVNSLLGQLGGLNKAIRDAEIDLASPNDLRDQRDVALDRLARLTGAIGSTREDGMVTVSLGGTTLLDGPTSTPMTVSGDPVTVTPSSGLSGTLGGLMTTLTVDVPGFRDRLDTLAVGLRDAVNDIHGRGTGLDGSTGTPFFTGDDAASLALDPGLTEASLAASTTGAAADGGNALAMSGLRTAKVLDGSSTLGEGVRAFSARVGQTRTDAARTATTAAAGFQGAALLRESLNGVNVDEEMVDLVKYQHAYSAASRVISVVDEMLDKIINQMGR